MTTTLEWSALPTLYKRSSHGAIEQWRVWVETKMDCGVIRTEYGQLEGKMQETSDTVSKGKNAGKANATTAVQQAQLEAAAKWTKKKERNGYVESLERAQAGETDAAGGIAPMLAQPEKDGIGKIVWPCDGQRKLNGNRCLVVIEGGEVTMWSRKRKQIKGLPHIAAVYAKLFADRKERMVFDGELFRFGWSLQKISGYCRKDESKEGFEQINHVVYDLPSHDGTWTERRNRLAHYDNLGVFSGPHVKLLQTTELSSSAAAYEFRNKCVADGYEGAILRNLLGKYQEDKRSYDLVKLKVHLEEEFQIVGLSEGRGKFVGKAIFRCKTAEGQEFECCAPGTMEDRAEFFQQGDALIGKMLTVKFFEWTDSRIPSHGVGLVVRDFE